MTTSRNLFYLTTVDSVSPTVRLITTLRHVRCTALLALHGAKFSIRYGCQEFLGIYNQHVERSGYHLLALNVAGKLKGIDNKVFEWSIIKPHLRMPKKELPHADGAQRSFST